MIEFMRYLMGGSVVAGLVLALLVSAAQAEPAGKWKVEDGIEAFHFETPELEGMFVARDERELGKGYGLPMCRRGVRPCR
jgi:hypothetical protein